MIYGDEGLIPTTGEIDLIPGEQFVLPLQETGPIRLEARLTRGDQREPAQGFLRENAWIRQRARSKVKWRSRNPDDVSADLKAVWTQIHPEWEKLLAEQNANHDWG
jgi:hypothetical protein